MRIKDRVYGQIEITDPLIQALIKTKAFQRLKKVNQYGGVNFVYPERYQVSRYEHSLGVWYVLNNLKTGHEIQVAGLLHDIGHTAFSHMLDSAMENKKENYHETIAHKIDGIPEINQILKAHKIKLKNVDDYKEIKKSLPDVGADRIDYALRDYIGTKNLKTNLGSEVLSNITLDKEGIVFTDVKIAAKYALMGLKAMWEVIYAPNVAVVYQSLIDMLGIGLKAGWLTEDDLLCDDKFVLNKMLKMKRSLPEKYINIFTKKFSVKKVSSDKPYDFKHVKLKVRYFDPFIKIDGKRVQLSTINKVFKKEMDKMVKIFEARKTGEYYKITWK